MGPQAHLHTHANKYFKHNANISAGPFYPVQWKSQDYFVFSFLDHIVDFDEFVIIVVAVAPGFMVIFILTHSDDKNTHRRLRDTALGV